jgi:hypothetical protein
MNEPAIAPAIPDFIRGESNPPIFTRQIEAEERRQEEHFGQARRASDRTDTLRLGASSTLESRSLLRHGSGRGAKAPQWQLLKSDAVCKNAQAASPLHLAMNHHFGNCAILEASVRHTARAAVGHRVRAFATIVRASSGDMSSSTCLRTNCENFLSLASSLANSDTLVQSVVRSLTIAALHPSASAPSSQFPYRLNASRIRDQSLS